MSDASNSEPGRLGRVDFELAGGRPLADYVSAFAGLEALYEGLLTIDRIIALSQEQLEPRYPYWRHGPMFWERDAYRQRAVYPSERLVLVAIDASSPGNISLLGDLKILEQIRLWLNDRAERRKDKRYRNREEERRLDLDNQQREVDLFQSRVELLRQAGIPEVEIAAMMREYIGAPSHAVEQAQDAVAFGELPPPPADDKAEAAPESAQ